jgi:hypothetical protein
LIEEGFEKRSARSGGCLTDIALRVKLVGAETGSKGTLGG